MKTRNRVLEIGEPGRFDEVFGLTCQTRKTGQIPRQVYLIVWKGDGTKVKGTPGFYNPLKAEFFVKKHRLRIIEENIDRILLDETL